MAGHPIDADGIVHLAMVRLEVEAYKPKKLGFVQLKLEKSQKITCPLKV